MRNNKDLFLGIMVGIFLVISIMFLMGAVNSRTSNVARLLGSNFPTLSLACSNDGQIVYVAGYDHVYLSKNFGKDWEIVLADQRHSQF